MHTWIDSTDTGLYYLHVYIHWAPSSCWSTMQYDNLSNAVMHLLGSFDYTKRSLLFISWKVEFFHSFRIDFEWSPRAMTFVIYYISNTSEQVHVHHVTIYLNYLKICFVKIEVNINIFSKQICSNGKHVFISLHVSSNNFGFCHKVLMLHFN